jgi:phosphoglycerate dehydrogenase-like enzyme
VVSSRSFSRNEELKNEMRRLFSDIRFNDEGRVLAGLELIKFFEGAEGAIVGLEKMTDEVLAKLPQLKVISKYGVGLDNLDLDAMKKRGIELGWTGGVNARSVSELALVFAMGLFRNVFTAGRKLNQGKWEGTGGVMLTGKTVGVIGCGFVGQDFSRLVKAFNCQILVHDIVDKSAFCREIGAKQVPKEMLLRLSDVVSLHVPYDKTTHHLIGTAEIELMKSTSILINTSRGNVVDERALCEALKTRRIRGAAADVFATEPPGDCELTRFDNFAGTPHTGGNSVEAIQAMGRAAIENLVKCLK